MKEKREAGNIRRWIGKHGKAIALISAAVVLGAYVAKELAATAWEKRIHDIDQATAAYEAHAAEKRVAVDLAEIRADVGFLVDKASNPNYNLKVSDADTIHSVQQRKLLDDLITINALLPPDARDRDRIVNLEKALEPAKIAQLSETTHNASVGMNELSLQFAYEDLVERATALKATYQKRAMFSNATATIFFLVGWGLGLITTIANAMGSAGTKS